MAQGQTLPIVVDNGSRTCKAGLAGEDAPCVFFPSIAGNPHRHDATTGISDNYCYIEDDATAKRRILEFRYPIKDGIVTNWDDMEKVSSPAKNNLRSLSSC